MQVADDRERALRERLTSLEAEATARSAAMATAEAAAHAEKRERELLRDRVTALEAELDLERTRGRSLAEEEAAVAVKPSLSDYVSRLFACTPSRGGVRGGRYSRSGVALADNDGLDGLGNHPLAAAGARDGAESRAEGEAESTEARGDAPRHEPIRNESMP